MESTLCWLLSVTRQSYRSMKKKGSFVVEDTEIEGNLFVEETIIGGKFVVWDSKWRAS